MKSRLSPKQRASVGDPYCAPTIPSAATESVERGVAYCISSLCVLGKYLHPTFKQEILALNTLLNIREDRESRIKLQTIVAYIMGYLERLPNDGKTCLTYDDVKASIAPVTPAPMLVHGGLLTHHHGVSPHGVSPAPYYGVPPHGYLHPSVPSPSHVAPPMAHHDPGMYIKSEYVMIAGRLVKISR